MSDPWEPPYYERTHTHWLVIAILISGCISVGCIGWAVNWVMG